MPPACVIACLRLLPRAQDTDLHATADFFVVSLLAHGAIGLVSGYLPVLQVDAGVQIGEIGLFSAVAMSATAS